MSKLIAVTGNGNSGKTIFSFYLAQALSTMKKKVVLISTDGILPVYSMLFPTKKSDSCRSLGKLLSLVVITEADVFNNAFVVNDNLMMLSYAKGENYLSYPEITEINLENLFYRLKGIADFVIVDTSTYRNNIDHYVLKQAVQICTTTADEKGCCYRNFYKPDDAGAIELLYNNSPYNPISDISNTFRLSVKFSIIPYCNHLEGVFNAIDITDISPSRGYRKIIEKVVGDII